MTPLPQPFKTAKRRLHHKRQQFAAPPGPLMLVSAWYDSGGPELTLEFDRAIDITAYDGTAIVVLDQVNAWGMDGTNGATLLAPTTVLVGLSQFGATPSGPLVLFTASGASGIVAVDDASTWTGVADLELPFP